VTFTQFDLGRQGDPPLSQFDLQSIEILTLRVRVRFALKIIHKPIQQYDSFIGISAVPWAFSKGIIKVHEIASEIISVR
jgi:hypothetical protein